MLLGCDGEDAAYLATILATHNNATQVVGCRSKVVDSEDYAVITLLELIDYDVALLVALLPKLEVDIHALLLNIIDSDIGLYGIYRSAILGSFNLYATEAPHHIGNWF